MGKIILWTLGSLEHKIVPSKAAVQKLKDLLSSAREEGGMVDLIWGPDLDFKVVDNSPDDEHMIVETMEEVDGLVTIKARRIEKKST
jgi:hypothetical protein